MRRPWRLLPLKEDMEARERLIMGNLRLVLSVIQKFSTGENLDDLFRLGASVL